MERSVTGSLPAICRRYPGDMNDPYWNLPAVPAFTLASPDFEDGARLPQWARAAGADGEDRSPALEWSGVPDGTRSFVLTCYDPDAPTQSGYWHWAVADIPGELRSLPQNAGDPASGLMPDAAVVHPTDSGHRAYEGAGAPKGHGAHRYFFTLYALDVDHIELPGEASPVFLGFTVNYALKDHLLGRASLVGTSITE